MNNNPGMERLVLTGEMNVYNAAELKASLLETLDRCNEVELDLAQVGDIDSAGLQILLLAKREANRHNKALRIVAHSAAVREALDFCNTAAFFGDPMVIPAREQI
jgi:anti-anti-sigma factor